MSSLGTVTRLPRAEVAPTRTPSDLHTMSISTPHDTPCKVPVPSRALLMWNAAMATFHTALFVTTIAYGNRSLRAPVYMTELNFTTTNSSDPTVPNMLLIPEYKEVGYLPLTWLVGTFFLVSAFFHAGNATLWRRFYEYELSCCRSSSRWIEYFFSASIMILLISYATGIREYTLLIAVMALIATTMPFGWLTELGAEAASLTEWKKPFIIRASPHLIGYIPQTAAWLVILLNYYDETEDKPPAWVSAVIWAQLALFFAFGIVQVVQQCSQPQAFYMGEIAYQVLSLAAKGTLGGLLLFNVLALGTFDEIYN